MPNSSKIASVRFGSLISSFVLAKWPTPFAVTSWPLALCCSCILHIWAKVEMSRVEWHAVSKLFQTINHYSYCSVTYSASILRIAGLDGCLVKEYCSINMQGMNKLPGALPPTIMEDGYEEYNDIIYSTCQCSSIIIVSRFGNQTVSANCILHEWIRPEAMPLHPFARKIKDGAGRCPQPRSIRQVKTPGRFKKRISGKSFRVPVGKPCNATPRCCARFTAIDSIDPKDDNKLDTASAIGSRDSTRTPVLRRKLVFSCGIAESQDPKTQDDSTSVTVQSHIKHDIIHHSPSQNQLLTNLTEMPREV